MPPTPLRLSLGSRGRIVAEVQRTLGVASDGVLGPVTLAAMRRAVGSQTQQAFELDDLWRMGAGAQLGVDLSGHNEGGTKGPVDFKVLRAAGVTFAWLKLTEGQSYTNTEAARQVDAARKAGILVGGYHFGDPSADRRRLTVEDLVADAEAEADHYLSVERRFFGDRGPDLVPMLDVERGYASKAQALWYGVLGGTSGARAAATATWCGAWLGKVPRAGVYTALWAVQGYLGRAAAAHILPLAARPLWLASYNAGAAPARPLPHPWRDPHVWQISGTGRLPGVDGAVDLDIALGVDLRALTLRSPPA